MQRDKNVNGTDSAEVSDSPEWTQDELARSRSFAEAFPDLAESLKGGIQVEIVGATQISVRLADDVVAHYRAYGDDLETRINADLRRAAGLET